MSQVKIEELIASEGYTVTKDSFYGFERLRFNFQGYNAWIVLPSDYTNESRPWTWTMQWAESFVPRTPALHLLRQGWHHVTIDTFNHRMDEQGIKVSQAYYNFLTSILSFNKRACLIGMSWGGFFSTRFAIANPKAVAAIYYDCPLLTFENFQEGTRKTILEAIGPWAETAPESWLDDPRMPLNMAESLAKTKIPIYLVYGGADRVVPPENNCEAFIPRYQAAGGNPIVCKRNLFGHHPHGLEESDQSIANFFIQSIQ